MSEGETRVVDPRSGDVALFGATREVRPNEFRDGPAPRCPFCPGNESETPPEIAASRGADGEWRTRVFANKYPVVAPPAGEHEVIVDSPSHAREITIEGVCAWLARYRAACARLPNAVPVLFKNAGLYAGATIAHPHTQLVVVSGSIPRLREIARRAEAYARANESCAWCDEIAMATATNCIVREDDAFVVYARAESRFSWALTIAPRRCAPSFETCGEREEEALTAILSDCVDALDRRFGAQRSFNLYLTSDPHACVRGMHWHFELVARVGTLAGFELATGLWIKSVAAQESAEQWRQMLASRGPV